jgi:hypothetical protein
MLRHSLAVALVLGVALSSVSAQEGRERTRSRTVERSVERTAPGPAAGAERAAAAAPIVSMQMVMVEVGSEAADKAGPGQPPASAESPRGPATVGVMDLSASSEKILEELRKVGIRGRLDVLYRMTLTSADQQKANFQLAHQQPQISGISLTQFGQTNNITMLNTGLQVEIKPRVDAGGIVSMTIYLEDSRVGRDEEGVPLSVSSNGETVRTAPIHKFSMQTAVNVPSGKTIVLSGVISEEGPRKSQLMVLLCPRIIPLNPSEASKPVR